MLLFMAAAAAGARSPRIAAAAGGYVCYVAIILSGTASHRGRVCAFLAAAAGSNVTIELTGTTTKQIVAGVFKYQVYETGVQSFVSSGNIQYFFCTIKGCNTAQPIALTLASGSVPTGFTGVIPLTIPQPQKTGEFSISFWGEDQDH
jgi:hypothetical protein